jgi:hypothetical protein
MDSASAISTGFRRAAREPEIVLAEIAWRWTFGLAALALAAGSLFVYLDTLPVTNIEAIALRSHTGWLIADTLSHILRGSGPRLLAAIAIIIPALFALWIAAATAGRTATIKALLPEEGGVPLRPQLGLNFLRAAVGLASLVGYLGATILAGQAAARGVEVRPRIFFSLFLTLALAITMARSRLSWFLSLAAISAARENLDTLSAISSAVELFRRRAGNFVGAGAVCAVIHGALWVLTTVLVLLVLSLGARVPPGLVLLLLLGVTLAYFAVCDFLYIARFAMYVAIDESDRTPPAPPVGAEPPTPAPPSELPLQFPQPGVANPEGAGA